ncbi:hypothetical protein ACJ73_09846 [Blastomyces percursus]|uniref:Uncharacterized protein n=1 Tax=Blastomyces percursus TaxID=1658174 RepID=A0A1J9PR16_9EURO|nr:hypothetical protein ACJ73_09846 [Blastomyces percursus]
MPVQSVKKLHGLQELPVKRRHYAGFVEDGPLTEEQKEQNRKSEQNVSLLLKASLCGVKNNRHEDSNLESLRDRTPSSYPEPDTPELFYRAFKDGCHGHHSKDLGFRSSDQPLSYPVYHDGTLLNSMVVDEEVLRNHCEGTQPSNLIALSDSPSRILNILRGWVTVTGKDA